MEPQPPLSHSWEGSIQSILPSWRSQFSLNSKVFPSLWDHTPSPFFPQSEGLGWLLSSRTRQCRQEGVVVAPFPFSRIKILAFPQGALVAKRHSCAHSPFYSTLVAFLNSIPLGVLARCLLNAEIIGKEGKGRLTVKAKIQVKGSWSEPRCKCLSQKLRQVTLGPHWESLKAKVALLLAQPLPGKGKEWRHYWPGLQISCWLLGLQTEREGT